MNSREKGKRGERLWRDELRARGYDARRGQQYSGSPESPDVICAELDWIHFEVKAVERLNIEDAMEQAHRDGVNKTPVVAHRRSHRSWLVTMRAETFFQFLRGELPLHGTAPVAPYSEREGNKITRSKQSKQSNKIMKIKANSGNFQPCPEYTGPAVCVDVTPLKTVQTQFGPKEKFRCIFEIPKTKDDGTPCCVWSAPFTLSYHENAALRRFLLKWMGYELAGDELKNFDTENLLGRPAHITVIHEHSNGEIYANIALIQPDKSAEPLKPSGKFIRIKDRPPKEMNSFRRSEQQGTASADLGATKIHVGKCKGLEVRDLAPEQVQALVDNWLPAAKANLKPTADDNRLLAALDEWQAKQTPADEDMPF